MGLMKKNLKGNIHKDTLELIYLLIMVLSAVTLVTNLINNRPINVYGMSMASTLICFLLYYLSSKKEKVYQAKLVFLIIFNMTLARSLLPQS